MRLELTAEQLAAVILELQAKQAAKPKTDTLSHPKADVDNHMYWHVFSGAFDTMIDYRDADNADAAVNEAIKPLQAWYVRKISFADAPHAEVATHKDYIDWLRRSY